MEQIWSGDRSLGSLDHTIERSVLKLWNDAQVKESFERKEKGCDVFQVFHYRVQRACKLLVRDGVRWVF
jgi:hypothetical protein